MKKKIHPKYYKTRAICVCGTIIHIFSTLKNDINLDICSACHPFYTGKQRMVNIGGRIDKFNKKFNIL